LSFLDRSLEIRAKLLWNDVVIVQFVKQISLIMRLILFSKKDKLGKITTYEQKISRFASNGPIQGHGI